MPTLTHRLQVLLDDERAAMLERLAAEHQTTVAALVRAALDQTYGSSELTRAEAASRFLEREPIDLGDWTAAKRQIEDDLDRAGA